MISNLISHQSNHNSSPFNTIRHLDDNGNEYWLAKELMELLGYKKWQRFVDTIDRAKIGCHLSIIPYLTQPFVMNTLRKTLAEKYGPK